MKKENALDNDCVVISSKDELIDVCLRYRIPNVNIQPSVFESYKATQYPFVVSKNGISECNETTPNDLKVFKSLDELRSYLFEKTLFEGKIVVFKENYKIYLKTIKLLKKIGIKSIRDKTYFKEANAFYVERDLFRELNYFGCKCITSMLSGIQFKAREFLCELKRYLRYVR